MNVSPGRVLGVTLGLSVTGAVCGAVLGAFALLVDLAATRQLSSLVAWQVGLAVGALVGALFGSVLAPLIAWIFLRRVTFARAIAQTAFGVVAGVVIGALARPGFTVLFGLAGFVSAAIWLWVRTGTRRPTIAKSP